MIFGNTSGKRIIFLLLIFLATATVASAQDWELPVTVRVEKNDKKLEGAVVTLTKSGNTVQSLTTSSNGKVDFKLAPNGDYQIAVTKSGHITKKFSISTYGVSEERGKEGFGVFEFTVGIFGQASCGDYSILNQPIAKVKYDGKAEDFNYDQAYTNSILSGLEKLKGLEDKARLYDAAIAKADKQFAAKDYANAVNSYTEASNLLTCEKYPKEKIEESQRLLDELNKNKDKEAAYKAAITKGDQAFTAKDWNTAKTAYNEALGIKSGEQYPKTKLAEIDAAIAKENQQKELNEKYQAAIKKGDDAFAAKDWNNAKSAYTEASGLKPTEAYPKTKITEIDGILAKELKDKELNEKYQAAIKKGDDAFAAKTYAAAKTAYNEALGLKPTEAYPKNKIAEIDGILAKELKDKELNDKYNAAVAKGDKAFANKTWEEAKAAYNEALGLKSSETYPKTKIAEIDGILAKELKDKELNEKYQAAIKKGDDAFAAKTWTAAKTAYNEALGLKPTEAYPKNKITEIDGILAKEAKDKELETKYLAAIKKGDDSFNAKTWAAAKTAFTEASGLKPTEEYPRTKLKEIEDILAKEAKDKELNDKYNAAVKKGDAAFTAKKYDEAKTGYNEALTYKAEEAYPKNKLKEIDDLLAKDAKQKELNDKYNAAIAKGDKAFGTKSWEEAKAGYNEALGVKPDEAYPKNKLKEIDAAIAKEAKDKENEEKYLAAIKKADEAFGKQDYENAKTAYTEASGLKSSEAYPKNKITEINGILAKNAKDKELEAKYQAAIKKGDDAFGAKTYAAAKTAYNEALTYKSTEEYPKKRIAEIDDLLAKDAKEKELNAKYNAAVKKGDDAFAARNWTVAKAGYTEAAGLKPGEEYPKTKLAEIDGLIAKDAQQKELNDKYNAAIKKADQAFTAKSYDEAKAGYNEALTFKSEEAYPKNKLKEIEDLLAKDAKQKELNDKYNAAIAKADEAFGKQDYDNAKTAYNEALGLKPTEAYPKNKITEINNILAKNAKDKELEAKYQAAIKKGDDAFDAKTYAAAKTAYNEALTYKSAEEYPKKRIAEIDDLLAKDSKEKELNAKYNAAIKKGDDAFAAKNWTVAKAGYTEATGLKPSEEYPKTKLAELDGLMAKDAQQKELNDKYNAAIKKADQAFTAKKYDEAKTGYNEALTYKAEEAYPKNKLKEIDDLLAKDAKQQELNDKYNAAIAKADEALGKQDYENAKTGYNEALGYKPAEVYPKNKLKEIDAILAQGTKQKEIEEKYKAAIAKGNNAFGTKDLANAKLAYKEATTLKPGEQYPKDKLDEIDRMEKDALSQSQKDAKYNAAIKKADGLYAANKLPEAKAAYQEAVEIKDEQYPKDKIAEITKKLDDIAAAKKLEQDYKDAIAKGDKAFTAKGYKDALAAFKEASGLKPGEKYPKDKIKTIEDILKKDNALTKNGDDPKKMTEEERKKQFQSELLAKYPPGVTEESSQAGDCKILRRVVVKDNEVKIYERKVWGWGGTFWFKDGSPITEAIFEAETN